MIEDYLQGAIGQSLERERQLREIVQRHYRREYDGLRQICLGRLDSARAELQTLAREAIANGKLQTPRRLREFKRAIEQLNAIESVGAFALSRAGPEDDFLNELITAICREIRYPLVVPTVSQMSQEYFHIYPEFNLLCLPLIEGRFLLHLPDIYHELCHPLHRPQNLDLPKLEPYHDAYKQSLFAALEYFDKESVEADRLRKPEARFRQIQLWCTCWIKYWMEELFCDLFGVLTSGPAYAWAHYHLCIERGGDPFETPHALAVSHPADDARMKVILKALSAMGFPSDCALVEGAWKDFLATTTACATPEYSQCYSDAVTSQIVGAAKDAVEGIGIRIAAPGAMPPAIGVLNDAWRHFWLDPRQYPAWEKKSLDGLRTSAHAAVSSPAIDAGA